MPDPFTDIINAALSRAATRLASRLEAAVDDAIDQLTQPQSPPPPPDFQRKSGVGRRVGRGKHAGGKRAGERAEARPRPASGPMGPTLYDLLQVSPRADQETIRAAFASLSRRYHPDVAPGKQKAKVYAAITAAYNTLKDVQKRKEYDRSIGL